MPTPLPAPPQQPAPVNTVACRCCGSIPAIKATSYRHQGLLLFMRTSTQPGPYCKPCGITVCRDMSAKTLWQGWWGPLSLVITPVLLVMNLITRIRLGRLADPAPGAPGTPAVPGKPLFMRAAVLGLAVPVLIAGAIAWGISRDPSFADVGACIRVEGTGRNPDVTVVDCSEPSAEYVILGKFDDTVDDSRCDQFPETVAAYTKQHRSTKMLLCLGEN